MLYRNLLPIIAAICSFVIHGCDQAPSAPSNDPLDTSIGIQQRMEEQQNAWNNGDLEGFMACYWKSDSLQFIGSKGITYGWQSTLNNYRKSYPNHEAMGKLKFTHDSTRLIGDSMAYVVGKWQLLRTHDTLGGYYSLLWRQIGNQWYIIADHTS